MCAEFNQVSNTNLQPKHRFCYLSKSINIVLKPQTVGIYEFSTQTCGLLGRNLNDRTKHIFRLITYGVGYITGGKYWFIYVECIFKTKCLIIGW